MYNIYNIKGGWRSVENMKYDFYDKPFFHIAHFVQLEKRRLLKHHKKPCKNTPYHA